MGRSLQEIEIIVEEPINPWQVVNGDGQTWIIMRAKHKLPEQELSELGQLLIEESTSKLMVAENGRYLYRGNIRLKAYYRGDNNLQQSYNVGSVSDEEEARKRLSNTRHCPVLTGGKSIIAHANSVFPSRLYLEPEQKSTFHNSEEMSGFSVWSLELPWQGWLQGGELQGEPKIVAAHLCQIGLSTLLCEVLVCLTAVDQTNKDNLRLADKAVVMNEEAALIVPDQSLGSVVGSAVQRAFFQVKPNQQSSLELGYWGKINLFFIGADSGGERILTGWGLFANTMRVHYNDLPARPDFISSARQEKITLVRAGEQKVILKAQTVLTLSGEAVDLRQEVKAPDHANEIDKILEAAVAPPENLIARPRPGEKWLSKKIKNQAVNTSQQQVLTIKFAANR